MAISPLFTRDRSRWDGPWFGLEGLEGLYAEARARIPGGGPPLHIFRTLPDETEVPDGIEPLLLELFDRALRRIRVPSGDVMPAIGVRVDVEEKPGGDPGEVVVRVYDSGSIADPISIPPIGEATGDGWSFRREPPTGPWTGVTSLRVRRNVA